MATVYNDIIRNQYQASGGEKQYNDNMQLLYARIERCFVVDFGEGELPNKWNYIIKAVNASGIPQKGEAYPMTSDEMDEDFSYTQVTGHKVTAIDGGYKTLAVTVIYEYFFETSQMSESYQEVQGTLNSEMTAFQWDPTANNNAGDWVPIVIPWSRTAGQGDTIINNDGTYPFDDTITPQAAVQVARPILQVAFRRTVDVTTANSIRGVVLDYLGRLNSTTFLGYAEAYWRCDNIVITADLVHAVYNVSLVFSFHPMTWWATTVVHVEDPLFGGPPKNIWLNSLDPRDQKNNGWTATTVYRTADFNTLVSLLNA